MHRVAGCGIEQWTQRSWMCDTSEQWAAGTCEHSTYGCEIHVNTYQLALIYKWAQSSWVGDTSEHRASGSYIQVNTEKLGGRHVNTEQLGVRYKWTQNSLIWDTCEHRASGCDILYKWTQSSWWDTYECLWAQSKAKNTRSLRCNIERDQTSW